MATRKVLQDFRHTKLVVILGSTATGKSKLGIELAKLFNGEVISADSMQVYKGLDIITNKVTPEESAQVKHHLINIVTPGEEFTVVDFKKRALDVIEDLSVRGRLPIIVGGTNYFIESLLWDFLIDENKDGDMKKDLQDRKAFTLHNDSDIIEELPAKLTGTEEKFSIYEQLMEVDPERASQLHPNNVRKISRSLQIFHSTGKKHSTLIDEQKEKTGSSMLSGPLRFPKCLVFWLTADQEVLDKRISTRVDGMMDKGLLDEVKTFYEKHIIKPTESKEDNQNKTRQEKNELCYNKLFERFSGCSSEDSSSSSDDSENTKMNLDSNNKCHNGLCKSYEEGLFQAIGFKEFHSFLTYGGDDEKEKEKLLSSSLERLKQITTKYSKKQRRWVQNRFLGRPKENSLPIYNLDATDILEWEVNVFNKAKEISSAFMNDLSIPYESIELLEASNAVNKHRRYVCSICNDRVIIGDEPWEKHQQSRKHKKLKANKAKSFQYKILPQRD